MSQIIDITKVKKERLKKKSKDVILSLDSHPVVEYLDHHMEVESLYCSFLNMASEAINMHLKDIPFISELEMDTDLLSFHRFVESYVACKEAMGKDEPMFKYAFRYNGKDSEGNIMLVFDLYEKHGKDVEGSQLLVRHLEEADELQVYSWRNEKWFYQNPDTLSMSPEVFFSREEEREMYMAFMAAFPDAQEDIYGEKFYVELQLLMVLKHMLADESRFIVINNHQVTDPCDKDVHIALVGHNSESFGMAISLNGDSFEVRRYLDAERLNYKGYHLLGGLDEVVFCTEDIEKVYEYAIRYWRHAPSCQDYFQIPISDSSAVELDNLEDLSLSYLKRLNTSGKVTKKLKKTLAETEERVKRLIDPDWKAS